MVHAAVRGRGGGCAPSKPAQVAPNRHGGPSAGADALTTAMKPPDYSVREAAEKLPLERIKGLVPHDFSALFSEKCAAHLAGTREWAFAEILAWFNGPLDGPQLFWLMGGGGTGKSVLTAALHQRIFERVVAWHYCRHDNTQASSPTTLLRSLAAMLCHRLPGYADALGDVPAETVTDPKELFAALFEVPLNAV